MSAEKSDRIHFRVGPGTPMGDALRRYWTPICPVAHVAEPDCDPIRVWALGQSFVVFRDTAGQVGILDEACPHRKASLVYGRNEGGGIRCLWHQWKIATDGTLLETPNNDDCSFRDRVKANAYDVTEAGGLIWGYFGPKEKKPPAPWLPWFDLPADHVQVSAVDLDSNFVRNIEALVDSSHAPLLHADAMQLFREDRAEERDQFVSNASPEMDICDTDFGFRYAAIRKLDNGARSQARVTNFVAPYLAVIGTPDHEGQCHISVPQDDTHCRLYCVAWQYDHPMTDEDHAHYSRLLGVTDELLDRHGLRPLMPEPGPLGQRNHIVQDRAAMRRGETFSGHMGLAAEDASMTGSIPGISDYRGEHLVPADKAVVRLRRYLADIQRKVKAGEDPPGVREVADRRELYGKILLLENGATWRSLVAEGA